MEAVSGAACVPRGEQVRARLSLAGFAAAGGSGAERLAQGNEGLQGTRCRGEGTVVWGGARSRNRRAHVCV